MLWCRRLACTPTVTGLVAGTRACTTSMEKASFAAGCFWGVEAAFRQIKGVLSTIVGYSGGTLGNPTYEDVCSHTTGHAETVLVEFDPAVVSYDQLLEVFWNCHDPTQLNRQGPDVGSQYRSAVFYHTPEQQAAAEASKDAWPEAASTAARSSPRSFPPPPSTAPRNITSNIWKSGARQVATCRLTQNIDRAIAIRRQLLEESVCKPSRCLRSSRW